jgi:cytochrome P450
MVSPRVPGVPFPVMSTVPEVALNPFEPGFFDDPYVQYRMLRELDPVHRSPLGPVALFRYEDVYSVLRNPRLSVEERNAGPLPLADEIEAIMAGHEHFGDLAMLNLDPPDHDRLRRLVSKVFTPRMIEHLRPRVAELVDGALASVEARGEGEIDVIRDLAFPLPFQVISEMLGMPEADRDQLRDWSHTMTKMLDPIVDLDEVRAASVAGDAMVAHVRAAIAAKRAQPADDLLSALVAAEDEGDVLSELELVAQVVLLYIAGHETTVNLIGNGVHALLRHPDQLARLRTEPELATNAIEELLRYDSPVQFSRRITLEAIEVAGVAIPEHTMVLTCLGSANRDPAKWGPTAEMLDLGREGPAQHVSFGSGVHHCLGAALARLEGQEAIPAFVRRFPELAIVERGAERNNRIVLRGFERLPVTLH